MQTEGSKQHYKVIVVFPNGHEKSVDVKAVDRETAERRARKFHPSSIGVKRDGA